MTVLLPPSTAERDDSVPHVALDPQGFHETGSRAGNAYGGSLKVGWTLRSEDGRIKGGFAFNINPQGLTRVSSSRAQVYATRGGFYSNDFGPGPTKISLRQLVASGQHKYTKGFGVQEITALREDVQRFIEEIYLPATKPGSNRRVFFHDNHFERGHDEEVFFPPDGLSIQRSVELHGVWLVELQMVGLEVFPFSDVDVEPQYPGINSSRRYVVKPSDTLHRIVVRLAGAHAAHKRRKQVLERILRLNPSLRHKRTLTPGSTGFVGSHTVTAKPMQVVPGEVLILPVR